MSAPSSNPLLDVRNVSVQYNTSQGVVRAVLDANLSIERGSTLALVGESGCGKSTLAKAIVGLLPPYSGSVWLGDEQVEGLGRRGRRGVAKRLQMIFQDPDASLNPRLTLAASVEEPLRLHTRLDRAGRDQRVAALFSQVGLDVSLRHRYPHELSGGQRQRVCIARALAVEPELLVCDEVVSALDVSVQAQIINLLRELQQRLGVSLLFITHDLAVVRQIADCVAVMYLGRIVEEGPVAATLDSPQHPYTQSLLAAVPSLGARGTARERSVVRGEVPSPFTPPEGCHFHPRCSAATERCRREVPSLVQIGPSRCRCWLYESAE